MCLSCVIKSVGVVSIYVMFFNLFFIFIFCVFAVIIEFHVVRFNCQNMFTLAIVDYVYYLSISLMNITLIHLKCEQLDPVAVRMRMGRLQSMLWSWMGYPFAHWHLPLLIFVVVVVVVGLWLLLLLLLLLWHLCVTDQIFA